MCSSPGCGQEITSPLPRLRAQPLAACLAAPSCHLQSVCRRSIYNPGGRLCISHLSPSLALCAAAVQSQAGAGASERKVAHGAKQVEAAALQGSGHWPEPWCSGCLWGFCNVYATMRLCRASSPPGMVSLPRQEAACGGGAVQGTGHPGAARLLDPHLLPPSMGHTGHPRRQTGQRTTQGAAAAQKPFCMAETSWPGHG